MIAQECPVSRCCSCLVTSVTFLTTESASPLAFPADRQIRNAKSRKSFHDFTLLLGRQILSNRS